ncbi:hypothetical protein [Cryobacterium sp. TMT2-14]|uniref:hypothetical protein n=1 Tax=Cryobacterium sp. TMT2-14 TaxID=1259245 RepID=UPI0010692C62|nr:hypothetical protein [Cryobacterium sp. TMT2-14]TFC33849.1 hypothetical protein E3O28_13235 [Cryobacterium sp. TMT2-14]
MSVYLAVGAFIAVDIFLVVLALGSHQVETKASAPRTTSTIAAVPRASTPTATPTVIPAAELILPLPPTRLLGAVDENTAWRGVTGDCPSTPASPELTTDGGATWKTTDATGPANVTALQRLMVTSASVIEMVGLTETDCAPEFVKTYVGGDNYSSYPDKINGAWYVDPADRATVHSPVGDAKAPCDAVVTLAVRDDESAAALCADGLVFATADAARTWSEPSRAPGVMNLAAAEGGYLAAAVGTVECDGVQLLMLTAALAPSPFGCYPSTASPAKLSGNVTVSETADTMWLWAGDSLARSADGGATWK